MNRLNSKGRAILETFEGNSLEAYQDQGGVWTIGRGSTRGVTQGMVITPAESDARFEDDIAMTCAAVDGVLSGAPLNENQYSAFVCFAFNVKGWARSPLAALVKAGDVENAEAHWLLYNKITVNGVKTEVRGLLNRRKAELDLYLAPVV